MIPGLTSVIIPTYQHADVIGEAIESALAQTVPVEVIVVDDGSTDCTAAALHRYVRDDRVHVFPMGHRGPCAARNAGIDVAAGEFVMFLDADDLLDSNKVSLEVDELRQHPDAGWCFCDVNIDDAAKGGQRVKASQRYRYDDKTLSGWLEPQLRDGNFIPIMAPLVRRSVLSDVIRFDDARVPEDWHFWIDVARAARVRYVPKVLATYRKSRTGRSRIPLVSRKVSPTITQPLRLNLACGTPNTRSWHPINGLVNLDRSLGWKFEDGLGEFVDHSVAGITVSHALMYVDACDWHFVFSEFARVLVEGGVVRITEDETADPRSARVGGWRGSEPAVTMTTPAFVREHLERVGLTAVDVDKATTRYRDKSLCQAQHGEAPDVFFVEGVKVPGVVFAPHSDDESLFCAFTILRHRPRVVVCFGSSGDYGSTAEREAETRDAMTVLGAPAVEQWATGDLFVLMRDFDRRVHPIRVWAPDRRTSHPDHLAVAVAAAEVFGDRVTTYHTYDERGKVRSDREVAFEPEWISHKLRALARYQTQIKHRRANAFFVEDLREYLGTGP